MKCIVVGSGIAAALLVEQIKEHKPVIIAPEIETAPPTALVHPFPGRSIQPHPLLGQAVAAMLKQMQEWNSLHPELCRPITMHRPLTGKGGERLNKAYLKYKKDYEGTPVSLKKASRCVADGDIVFRTGLAEETLSYQPAFAVDIQTLIKRRFKDLEAQGVQRISQRLSRIRKNRAYVENGETFEFDHLFLAIGSGWSDFFPKAELSYEGGSLLQTEGIKHTDAFSVNGLHFTANRFNQSVIGSTRWHTQAPDASDCMRQLKAKASNILHNTVSFGNCRIWRGMRSIHKPDRLPIGGRLPTNDSVSVIGALGNKGLLWGPLTAAQVAENTFNKQPVSSSLSLSRTTINFASPRVT